MGVEFLYVARVQRQPHDLTQEETGLLRREAQVVGAQFGELAERAQPRQRQRRILPRDNDQMHVGWLVSDESLESFVDSAIVYGVEVVQHQQEVGCSGSKGRGGVAVEAHVLTTVVLPKPAGAQTRIN